LRRSRNRATPPLPNRTTPTFTLELGSGGAPDYVEPLTAYRAWYLKNGRVLSLNSVPWKPGLAMVAKCDKVITSQLGPGRLEWSEEHQDWVKQAHVAPSIGCTCGIYAGKNLEHLCEMSYAKMGHLHGEVSLWGRVMDCDQGYRAQYAYPKYFVIQPWTLVGGSYKNAEARLAQLIEFDVDIYFADDIEVSRDMAKTLLRSKGQVGLNPEAIDGLFAGVQRVYDWMSKQAKKPPMPGDRLFVHGHGIAIIEEVDENSVVAKLFNTSLCRVPRRDVRFKPEDFGFECNPSEISFRTARNPRPTPL
jgi:hypothetical protein